MDCIENPEHYGLSNSTGDVILYYSKQLSLISNQQNRP